MKKENCKTRKQTEKKTVVIAMRITPSISKWLRKEELSPTGIFFEAIKELGYTQK